MKNNVNIFWRIMLFVSVIAILGCLALLLIGNADSTASFGRNYTSVDYSHGWVNSADNSPIELENNNNYIFVPYEKDTSYELTIRKSVDKHENEGALIGFRTRSDNVRVRVNGDTIFTQRTEGGFREPLFYTTYIAKLPELIPGDVVEIRIKSCDDKGYFIQNLALGDYSQLVSNVILNNIATIMEFFALVVMSIILFVIFLTSALAKLSYRNYSTLWLALFTLLGAFWIVSDYGILDYFIPSRALCFYINAISFMFLPLCFIQFIKNHSFKNEKFLDFLSALNCMLIITDLLVYFMGFADLLFDVYLYHILSIVGIIWIIIKYVTGNFKVPLEIIVGIGALFCFSTMNIIVFWTNRVFPSAVLFSFGAIIFAACMFFLTMHKLVDLQHAKLREENYRTEKDLAVNKMLLTQISSHFFYNTMNTIRALIKTDTDAAYKMVGDFGKYMRFYIDSVNVDAGIIKFTNELVAVKAFADISKVQMGDRLNMVYDIQCDDFDMPQLTVQPLVENAIKHGIGAKPEGGTVKLTVKETPDNFTIEVADDGKGFYTGKDAQKNSVAIKNIRQRLSHFRDCAMIIKSVPNEGSVITLLFPKNLVSGSDNE